MAIAITCSKCRKNYAIKDEHAGQTVGCSCGQTLTVPLPLPGAAPAASPTVPYPQWMAAGVGGAIAAFFIGAGLLVNALWLQSSHAVPGGALEVADSGKEAAEKPEKDARPDQAGAVGSKETVAAADHVASASPEQVYKRLLKSTAWIVVLPRGGGMGWGSGALVHQEKRLVFTNYHVIEKVGADESVLVFFPHYRALGKDRELVTSPQAYIEKIEPWGVPGRVVFRNAAVDLALVQLEREPEGVPAIPIAAKSAAVGQSIISIGNSGATDGTLWRLTPGQVRQVYEKKANFANGQKVDAWMVETSAPINPGDSGGPVVNDRAQVVAVVSSIQTNKQLVSSNIDARELRDMLQKYFNKEGLKWEEPAAPDLADPDRVLALMKQLDDNDAAVRAKAIRALGNQGSDAQSAVPALIKLWSDADPVVRQQVALALERIGPPAPAELGIVVSSLQDPRVEVRRYSARVLVQFGPDIRDALEGLGRAVQDADVDVRRNAVRALGSLAQQEKKAVVAPLVAALKDSDNATRREAALGLATVGPEARRVAFALLLELLADTDPSVNTAAGKALVALGPPESTELPLLVNALKHASPKVKIYALYALAAAGQTAKGQVPDVALALQDPIVEVRAAAAVALSRFGADAKSALPKMFDGMKDQAPVVRRALVEALGRVGPEPGVIPALMAALSDTNPTVAGAVETELKRLRTFTKADVPELLKGLQNEAVAARLFVLSALENLGPDAAPALDAVAKLLKDPSVRVRMRAVKVLGAIGAQAKPAAAALGEALIDKLPSTNEIIEFDRPPVAIVKGAIDAAEIRKRLMASAAWVCWHDTKGTGGFRSYTEGGAGTACVVDLAGRLLLTNYRTIGKQTKVFVFFPRNEKDNPIVDIKTYIGNATRYGIPGSVIATDPSRDLALIRVQRLPGEAQALPLGTGAEPGQAVHSLGGAAYNPRLISGSLWQFRSARVAAVASEQIQVFSQFNLSLDGAQQINARVVKTDGPLSPGDGGGPVVNEQGQLVAVISGQDRPAFGRGVPGRGIMSGFNSIDVREVRAFLEPHLGGTASATSGGAKDDSGPAQIAFRKNVLRTLKRMGPAADAAVASIEKLLEEKDLGIRLEALAALGAIGPEARNAIPDMLRSIQDNETQAATFNAIAEMGKEAIPILLKSVEHQDQKVRLRSAQALGRFAKDLKPHRTRLQRLQLEERNAAVKAAIRETLNRIGPS